MSDPRGRTAEAQASAVRRRLIFFATADPGTDPDPAWRAYHFAEVAAEAGLDAEVRLAGDAVKVAKTGCVAGSVRGGELRAKAAQSHLPFLVSL